MFVQMIERFSNDYVPDWNFLYLKFSTNCSTHYDYYYDYWRLYDIWQIGKFDDRSVVVKRREYENKRKIS